MSGPASASSAPMDIDDSLYSRQRYVLGDSAMHRLARSNVLLVGLGGLGIEIAKNIILAGVQSLTIQDVHTVIHSDVGVQFFLKLDDVGKTRGRACSSRLSELNPHVRVDVLDQSLTDNTSLEYLRQFQCVALTESISLQLQVKINEFCRTATPTIKFVCADVRGLFCWSFCDFGADFEILDRNGEEPRDVFIKEITKGSPGVVKMLDHKMHGFTSGDVVSFKEVRGMDALNGTQRTIEVVNAYEFSIGDTSGYEYGVFESGGIVTQIKQPITAQFEPLTSQLYKPSVLMSDLSKETSQHAIHIGMLTLHKFHATYGRWPSIWCAADAEEFIKHANEINAEHNIVDGSIASTMDFMWRHMSYTAQGCFAPLCAFLGGVVAQEVLKALTGKFSPIQQWLHVDAVEVVGDLHKGFNVDSFQPRRTRYDGLRACIGEDICQKLAKLKLFMVGCGAIGCEMLKNYALLGVGSTDKEGKITITDNDLIEMSNLNRQFLFRPHHIQQPKSTTAANSAKAINPDLNIEAHQHRVCPQTEEAVYTDEFFTNLDLAVNALDNVEARKYMDSRCVTAQRALLESGTLGAKGHVQVIIPFLSENYASQRDPVDDDVPYCTLHSFPAVIEHCIEWARDKFEMMFTQRPMTYNTFWSTHRSPQEAITLLRGGKILEGVDKVSKLVTSTPATWDDCIILGRIKFEKFFNHKAHQLLDAFPLDTRLKDGTPFWQSPKRPPTPITFDIDDPLHVSFVVSFAHIYSDIFSVERSQSCSQEESIRKILDSVVVPAYKSKSKPIETDETAKKPEEPVELSGDELEMSINRLQQAADKHPAPKALAPASFEKDDDTNGHIDFISATSNLRAAMYNIEAVDRLKIKRIAGRIVPAIATTTAAIAGLVTIELVKLVSKVSLEQHRNAFINLAIPLLVFSEPGAAAKTKLSNGVEYTSWDRWEIKGSETTTLREFFDALKSKYNVGEPALVVQGVKMIYIPIMPGHSKRLPRRMLEFVKTFPDKSYVDLVVSYPCVNSDEEEMGPPVRFFFR